MLIIDPPSGWKYGFPKAMPKESSEKGFSLKLWLYRNGYPFYMLKYAKYSRYWNHE